jgi:hypothetical protein
VTARFAAQKRPPATNLSDEATRELRELVRLRNRWVQELEVQSTHGIVAAAGALGLLACLAGGVLPLRATHIPVAAAFLHE